MGIKQSYYFFVLLLASLTISCTSNCPITALASRNKSVGNAYQECANLYAMLETALFENPGNLYQLHDRFFPSSGLEPIYVKVFFELNNHHDIHWTSSVVLRSVRPAVLASFHFLLLNILLPYDLTAGKRAGITDAQLFIKPMNFTESDYPDYNITINAVLRELTSWLKVYASTQQRRSDWEAADHMYKGYSCEFNPSLEALLISTAVLTVALTTIALIKAVPKLFRKVASHIERGNQWYSFFWAASFMASVYNIYSLCVVLS